MTNAKTKVADPDISPPRFSPEDTIKAFELAMGSKSIELKMSVPVKDYRATMACIGFDPVEVQPRQVYFFDTPDQSLNKAGLIVRARRIQGGSGDTVVKLRPVDPATIDAKLRDSRNFKIELDAMPGGYVCSASAKGVCSGQEVLDVIDGAVSLRSLFSNEQHDFYDAHAPEGIKMKSLIPLGPTFLLKAKHQPKKFKRGITVELWLYPDGSRVAEISTKCLPVEAFQVAAEFKSFLAGCGISISSIQESKTKTAMDYFKTQLESAQSVGKKAKK